MQSIADFFSTIPDYLRTAILAGGFVLMWMVETAIPLFKNNSRKFSHAGINVFFTLTTIIVNFLFAVVIVKTCDWVTTHQFGLIHLISMPLWLQALMGVLLLDLIGAYFIHWLEHRVKWLWKFHTIHHTDVHVNTLTALRHHPGESVFRDVFLLIAILVTGSPFWMVMIYQSLSAFLSQFNHANIQLPQWLDRMIMWIFVSPGMHKVHHHYVLPMTDTNYGNIFSIWDRLFGTFARMNTHDLHYGLDIFPDENEHNNMAKLLSIPFEPYRPPSGSKFGNEQKS